MDLADRNARVETQFSIRNEDLLREHLHSVPAFRALIRSIECRLIRRAHPFPPPVLDLGCGDGHFASLAFSERPAAGIDPDFSAVQEARCRGSYLHCVVAGAERMPFRSSFFGTVVANCVLEHIPDLETALGEASRVLRQGGLFLLGVPSHFFAEFLLGTRICNRLRLSGLGKAYGTWFNSHSRHLHVDTPEAWCERLSRSGFEVVDCWYYMSPAAHRAFDLAHYLSIPRWVTRKLTGRWVIIPIASRCFEKWLQPHYESSLRVEEGAYVFFECRKGSGPVRRQKAR